MTSAQDRPGLGHLPEAIDRRFEAVVLFSDEVSTDPQLRQAVLDLLDVGVHMAVITAAPLAGIVDALRLPLTSPGFLLIGGGHGGEVALLEHGGVHCLPAASDGQVVASLQSAGRDAVRQLEARGVPATASSPSEFERDVVIELTPRADHAVVLTTAEVGELVAYKRATSAAALAELAASVAHDAGIADPRVWSEEGRVEISVVDEADALGLTVAELWDRGVSPSKVLVVADEGSTGARGCARATIAADALGATVVCVDAHEHLAYSGAVSLGGGRSRVVGVLLDQVRRRAERELPSVVPDPGWGLSVEGFDRERERVQEALFVLADGDIGTSGAPIVAHESARPWVIASGVYDLDGPETHPLCGPFTARFRGNLDDGGLRRTLDLRTGVVAEVAATDEGPIKVVRFSSLARPGTMVERVVAPAGLEPVLPLSPPSDGGAVDEGTVGPVQWIRVAATAGGITAAAVAGRAGDAPDGVYDRFAAFTGDAENVPEARGACDGAISARDAGFDRLFDQQRARWAQRWRDADVVIEGDERLQTAVRFALFHLMGSVRDRDEAAVGARGLTGLGYRGHVFWDADAFVLPFLASTHPASARAMLEYRVRRLPGAFAHARAHARRGARFPWESARTGVDVTPTTARDRAGRLIAIRTGQLEDHIVADVAWASSYYEEWTGDEEYRCTDGLRVVVATAQYWASRVRMEPDGRAHIYGVIGPDEYHEPVDDNVFTNVMARWNLRRAAAAVQEFGHDGISPEEPQRWLDIADALFDGYDPDTGIYEQCAGFLSLEPLIIAEVAPRRPIAADYLLGMERVRQAQIVKQPDVLMLHHLVPDEVIRGTLEPNLRFYEPRTAHGSSLSPAIYAALFARARDYARVLEALEVASRIDLDDLTGTSSAGLHIATMGGLWQALALGLAGLRACGGRLHLDPRLPASWSALEVHVRFRGSGVVVRRDRTQMTITAESPIEIVIDDRAYTVGARGLVFIRRYDTWGLTT